VNPPKVPETLVSAIIRLTLDYYSPWEIARILGAKDNTVRVVVSQARAAGKLSRYITGGIRISGDAFKVLRSRAAEYHLPVERYILEVLGRKEVPPGATGGLTPHSGPPGDRAGPLPGGEQGAGILPHLPPPETPPGASRRDVAGVRRACQWYGYKRETQELEKCGALTTPGSSYCRDHQLQMVREE
jgi:hypothetical protein